MFIFQFRTPASKQNEVAEANISTVRTHPRKSAKHIQAPEPSPSTHMLEGQTPNRHIDILIAPDCKNGPAKVGEIKYNDKTNSIGLVFSQWPRKQSELPLQDAYTALNEFLKTPAGQQQYASYTEKELSFLYKELGIAEGCTLSAEAQAAIMERMGKINFINVPTREDVGRSGQVNWTQGSLAKGYNVYCKFPMALEHELGHAASDKEYLAHPWERNQGASAFEEAFNSLAEGRDTFGNFSYIHISDSLFGSLKAMPVAQRKQMLDKCVGVWLNLPSAYEQQDGVYAFFSKALAAQIK